MMREGARGRKGEAPRARNDNILREVGIWYLDPYTKKDGTLSLP